MSSRRNQKRANQQARAKLAEQRRKRRTVWTSALVAAVLLIAGAVTAAVFISQQNSQDSRNYALPAGTSRNAPGLPVGHGAVRVDVYLDYMCPHCREFESLADGTLNQFTSTDKVTLVYHPLNFLNRFSAGTEYSTRSAAAAGCAADAGKLPDFTRAIFAKQPKENSGGLTNKQIAKVGKDAGITSPDFAKCVTSQKYADWVTHVSNQATEKNVHSTPTVFVDDKQIDASATALTAAINSAL